MSLQNLPNELLYQVYQYLTNVSVVKLSCSSYLYNLYSLSPNELETLCFSENPLYEACRRNYSQLLKFSITKGYAVKTALHIICWYNYKECLELLIKYHHNFDINYKDYLGCTALYEASLYGRKECLEILIKNGADINARNNYGATALHSASKECMKILLNHGANPNIRNNLGNTALHWACVYNETIKIKILLDHGSNTDIQNYRGYTALHYTSTTGHYQCMKSLLKHEANTDIQDNSGRTALQIAKQKDHTECIRILKK